MNPIVVVGDALLDRDLDGRAERLCPDAPVPVLSDLVDHARPGGAALAAALGAGDGRPVQLVTALGDDPPGAELAQLLRTAGVETIDLGCTGATAEKVRIRAAGQAVVRLDRGGPDCGVAGPLSRSARAALEAADVVLLADYGRGLSRHRGLRDELARSLPGRQIVWDPHPRGAEPVRGVRVVTPNATEAGVNVLHEGGWRGVAERAQQLATRWRAGGVAITLGARGALLVRGADPPLVVPAAPQTGDTCGAGDRFASALAGALADGAVLSEAVTLAVAEASAYVGRGGPRTIGTAALTDPAPPATRETADELVARIRCQGGIVVATGGCFDLLHTGHVRLLENARLLGDCLVVLLNSDHSVRHLKGPDRPVVRATDRAAVVGALACVDAVAEFDEDTPCAALDRLRPDVFVKGGDYGGSELPEQSVMARWGGQCVVLPYLEGRSTTRLLQEVQRRGLA